MEKYTQSRDRRVLSDCDVTDTTEETWPNPGTVVYLPAQYAPHEEHLQRRAWHQPDNYW